jgi:predicted permease
MKLLRRIASRLRGMLSGSRRDSELAQELESHIEMQTDDYIRSGMTPQEARRAARLKFGAVESIKDSYREQRGLPLLETLFADLRYAFRQMRSNKAFAITIIVTIALGIGANTAVFSVINTILIRPLPVSDPETLVWLTTKSKTDPAEAGGNPSASPADFVHWRAQSDVLENVSAFLRAPANYTGGDVNELWNAMEVSPDTFRVFRMPMLLGRSFLPEEERPNGPHVAILSRGLWQRHFAGDPRILGTTVLLSGDPYTVVGVVADSPGFFESAFDSPPTDVYVPFQIDPNTNDVGQIFYVVARLKPGVTAQQAKDRLRASTPEFQAKFPAAFREEKVFSFMTIRQAYDASDRRPYFVLLMLTVNGVLLIACANVANLLLARAVGRKREIGIRIAVGAGRRRVIRQMLTESVVLSLAGGAGGLLLAELLIKELFDLSGTAPAFWKVDIDWHVVIFTIALSVLTAVIFGLVPAFQASRVDLNTVLKDSGSRWSTGRQNKLRSALVVSEVGLAVVLLIGSALIIRSFLKLYRVERGFEAKNVYVMYSSFYGSKYARASAVSDAIRSALEGVRGLPGVETAGAAGYAPLTGNLGVYFNIVGRSTPDGGPEGNPSWTPVSPGYFDVFKIPVKRGRDFTFRDGASAQPVALINETMAKTFWKDTDPLNDSITVFGSEAMFKGEPPRQIVGIVGDIRQKGLNQIPEPRVYVPQAQLADATNAWLMHIAPQAWVIRTKTGTRDTAAAVQERLRQTTGLAVFDMEPMSAIVSRSTEDDRGLMWIMTLFSSLALLLAAVGIYGVMSYTVEQQRQEIGIRLALGAESSTVRNMVVRQGVRLTIAGLAIGLVAAWELMMLMEGLLFEVQPRDPLAFVTVPVLLGAVALFAVWLPATRASRVNPMDSLRCE